MCFNGDFCFLNVLRYSDIQHISCDISCHDLNEYNYFSPVRIYSLELPYNIRQCRWHLKRNHAGNMSSFCSLMLRTFIRGSRYDFHITVLILTCCSSWCMAKMFLNILYELMN